MDGCAVIAARSANEQLERVQKVVRSSVEILKGARNQLPREVRKELTRIDTCMDAHEVALAAQNESIAKIHGASSSSYVLDALEVHRKRTEREASECAGARALTGTTKDQAALHITTCSSGVSAKT